MKKSLLLCLTCLAAVTAQTALYSAETKPTVAGKIVPAQLTGKIVAVDKAARLITVEVKGTMIKVNMTTLVKIAKKGKLATFDELAPGQNISLTFMELPNGKLELATLTVEPYGEALEPAGKPGPPHPTHGNNARWENAPFGLPNPANINGRANSAFK